ncbi:hypothetical protein GCM10009844_43220 [Nocardioides koreensis]|uniref:Uncharacterized protein n=1 Tax=Nocardioides koreensis TaxID=433651 RepID=A0ABN3A7Q8_9ACTN
MLVTPASESPWRIEIARFGDWLTARWPDLRSASNGEGQRAHLWVWPDSHEVWIPGERDCAWVETDPERTGAVASWLASTTDEPLILCDEGYALVIPLDGATEAGIAARP